MFNTRNKNCWVGFLRYGHRIAIQNAKALSQYLFCSRPIILSIRSSALQLSPLFIGLATRVVDGTLAAGTSTKIVLDMASLFNAEFAAAAVLISFGAVLGKLSPTQVCVFVHCYSFCFPSF